MTRKIPRDDPWQRLEQWLPDKQSDPVDNRLFMEAVRWIARTGAPWRDLPPELGPWKSVYQRFARWETRGLWQAVFEELARDGDFEALYLDSTIPRAYPHAAGAVKNSPQALGRSRGGLSIKIHALKDWIRWRIGR